MRETKHGGILVYVLTDQDDGSAYRDAGIDIRDVGLSIVNPPDAALVAHQVRYRDGAVVLGPDGTVQNVNCILRFSPKSEAEVSAFPGTRHTAAARHSYDCPNVLVFVVSANGPVTVFSDGGEVAKLKMACAITLKGELTALDRTEERRCPAGASAAIALGQRVKLPNATPTLQAPAMSRFTGSPPPVCRQLV